MILLATSLEETDPKIGVAEEVEVETGAACAARRSAAALEKPRSFLVAGGSVDGAATS